jgi:hypothetical protein
MKMNGSMEFRLLTVLTALVAATGCGGPAEELATAQQEAVGTVEQAACSICPSDMSNYRSMAGYSRTCFCPSTGGYIWGTDIYTDDSTVCTAAVHAGVIPATGGAITVKVAPGRSSYTGSSRNGITSASYGAWPGSFTVSGAIMNCAQECPANLIDSRGKNGTVVTCDCTAESTGIGGLWGTDTYTDDSSLCRAALHAGRITTAGGTINAVIKPGQSLYTGSTRNGVTSSSYTAWPGSFSFQ